MIRIVGFLLAIITCAPTFCQKQNERLEISADAHGFIAFAPRSGNLSSDGVLELRKFRNWLQSSKTRNEYNITLHSLSPNSEADKFSGILRCKAILDSLTIHGLDPSIFYIGKDVSSDAENGVQFIIDDKYRNYVSPTTKSSTKEPRKLSVYKKYRNNFFDIQSSTPQLTEQGEKQLNDFKKWIEGGKHSYIVNLYGIDSQNNAGNIFALKDTIAFFKAIDELAKKCEYFGANRVFKITGGTVFICLRN